MYAYFAIYMLMGIKICDLYTFIKPSYSRVSKLTNVCNDGYCHCSVYDSLNYFFFKISFSYELQLLRGSSSCLLTQRFRIPILINCKRDSITHIHSFLPSLRPVEKNFQSCIPLRPHYFAAFGCRDRNHLSLIFLCI